MAEQSTQFSSKRGNRPVWVINSLEVPYVEEFRGEIITVPPNEKRKVSMPYLAARRFLGQTVAPRDVAPDGTVRDGDQGKALRTEEFTDTELKTVGMSKAMLEDAAKKQDNKAALACTICGDQLATEKGLKQHIKMMHKDAIPAEDED